MDFILTPVGQENINLYDYRAHIAEVIVQFWAVVLLAWAVALARQANKTAVAALVGASRDFADERKEYAKAMSDQRYDVLDKAYMELVLLRVKHPGFNEPERFYAKDAPADLADEKRKYQSYAFALFNYLETIADKCNDEIKHMEMDNKDKEKCGRINTPELVETWGPILVSESWLHRHWFLDNASRVDDRFKQKFRNLVTAVADSKSEDQNREIDSLALVRSSYA